jgi:hypothetical protein
MKIDILRALHKAGFPLKEVSKALSEMGITVPAKEFKKVFPNSVLINGKLYLPPTLEAAFNAIKSYRYLSFGRNLEGWTAEVTGAKASGKTPLETLLKLFLKIHSK